MKNWCKDLKRDLKSDVLLAPYTSFKVGGRAECFYEPADYEDLANLLNIIRKERIPFYILGAGSNLLISDGKIKGVVIRLNTPYFKRVELENKKVKAGSGVRLSSLLKFCLQNNLSGLEFLAGIPGTLGGALIMNAGTKDKCIGNMVEEVEVMDRCGQIRKLKSSDLIWKYRGSNLDHYIILSAILKLTKKEKRYILKEINDYKQRRFLTQDLTFPNAGCIFKNPKEMPAGELIERCGLKGKTVGAAQVSLKHANFIINRKNACARDILKLINYIKRKVKYCFGIDLELEIKIW